MEQKQLDHKEVIHNEYSFPIYLICDGIRSPENAGMIFRTSEAFGVQKIHFSNTTPKTDNIRLRRAARSTYKTIEHNYSDNLKELIIQLKNENFEVIGIEITNTSTSVTNYNFTKHPKIALVLGAEKNGISSEIIEMLDSCVHIPMYGKNSSMNVVNALGIFLYEITKQFSV